MTVFIPIFSHEESYSDRYWEYPRSQSYCGIKSRYPLPSDPGARFFWSYPILCLKSLYYFKCPVPELFCTVITPWVIFSTSVSFVTSSILHVLNVYLPRQISLWRPHKGLLETSIQIVHKHLRVHVTWTELTPFFLSITDIITFLHVLKLVAGITDPKDHEPEPLHHPQSIVSLQLC